jgi:hypothetical protein
MTQPIGPLTLDEAEAAMREVVAERGRDFRYIDKGTAASSGACLYAPITHPAIAGKIERGIYRVDKLPTAAQTTGCIVGEVLKRTGRLTNRVASAQANIGALIGSGEVSATDEVKRFLNRAQLDQDNGSTWGEALDAALRAVR